MGTNFYLLDRTHLGKRSAAGLYCYACNISLVTGQPGGYDPTASPHTGGWVATDTCPSCRGKRTNPKFYLPELFHPTPEETGAEEESDVRYAYCFSFAVAPEIIASYQPKRAICDEYSRRMSAREFREMIEGAAFLWTDSIGVEFS